MSKSIECIFNQISSQIEWFRAQKRDGEKLWAAPSLPGGNVLKVYKLQAADQDVIVLHGLDLNKVDTHLCVTVFSIPTLDNN